MASEIRVNQINNRSGLSTITFSDTGVVISGITTISDLRASGNTIVAAGTTASPSISPTGDSNTGIFFPSADTVAIAEGGVESARFDSSGRMGIGTDIPSSYDQGARTLVLSESLYSGITLRTNNQSTGQNAIYFSDGLTGNEAYRGRIEYYHSGDSLNFGTAGSIRVTIDSSGNLTLINSNLVMGTAGKGIDFSATANSSGTMTSELLSDYEEGTFSPFSASDVTNRGIVIPNQAFYIKIGRICHIWFRFYYSNTASSASISGSLPFSGSTPTSNTSYSPFFLSIFPRNGSPSHMGFCYNNGTNAAFDFYQNNANYVNLNWNSGCTEYTVIGAYQTV